MTGVDLEKCKRIVQYFWDPEPKNDTTPDTPIWCLGQQYTPHSTEDTQSENTGMRETLETSEKTYNSFPFSEYSEKYHLTRIIC